MKTGNHPLGIDITAVPALSHHEAMELAAAEFDRVLETLRALGEADWACPTSCPGWDVRALVSHVLGMAEAQASLRQFAHDFRAASRRREGPMIDAMTATQVSERAHLSPAQLVAGLAETSPRAVRARRRTPALVRRVVRMRQDPPFDAERWRYGYLVDVIFTRDAWMHRVDICDATGRDPYLTAEHDGRIVADVVTDWARRHDKPFTLTLSGPAGGVFRSGEGGDHLAVDAVEFCRLLSGRVAGEGLLAVPVPF